MIRRLPRDRRGTTTLEFAMIASMLFPLTFASLSVGALVWTRGTLQSVAAETARCIAINACTDATSYAETSAGKWLPAGAATTLGVEVLSGCNSAAGSSKGVTITSAFWQNLPLPPPFNKNLSVTACYPT